MNDGILTIRIRLPYAWDEWSFQCSDYHIPEFWFADEVHFHPSSEPYVIVRPFLDRARLLLWRLWHDLKDALGYEEVLWDIECRREEAMLASEDRK